MFKKILDDKQSYTINDEDRNLLFNTPNRHHNTSKRFSHNAVDETGSLISDYTEDDLEGIDNDDMNVAGAAGETPTTDNINNNFINRAPLDASANRRSSRIRNATSTTSPKIINTSIGRSSKRQKGSLTRQDTTEQKRSRTRSHDVS
jgi:hypothetical protein